MKKFPILYSRASTGKISQWQIFAKDDYFYVETGYIDGKITTSEPNYCIGKNIGKSNETSLQEQAILEAQSKFDKKVKAEGYRENLDDIDDIEFAPPMLAKKFIDRLKFATYPCICDPKFNGGRLVTLRNGQFTRKGERYESVPHLFEDISDLYEEYPQLYLDGEAYNHEYTYKLNEIMRLIRKTVHVTEEDLAESREKIKYYIYDGYGFAGITEKTPQFERRAALLELLKNRDYIVPVEGKIAKNEEEVFSIYESYVADNYEGAIVRLNGPYKHSRSSDLLKVKPEDDDEAIIVDINEGSGNWAGTGKVITLQWKNKEFNATFKGTYEQCVQFLKDKDKWVGREITFLYNGLTGLGIPNFARVDIDNCLQGKK